MENKKAKNHENFNTSAGTHHSGFYQADIR